MFKLQLSKRGSLPAPEFEPHPLLWNGHLMTTLPAFLPRPFKDFCRQAVPRVFQIDSQSAVLAKCHFHEDFRNRYTVLLVHGLEGSSESGPMLGIAEKVFRNGMNAVRINLRNCGGSMHLTSTLYNAGLSGDIVQICSELVADDELTRLFLVGYSLGGNIVLKAAAESQLSALKGVVAVSPSIDLNRCVESMELPGNAIYQEFFLRSLKKKIQQKSLTHPDLYDASRLTQIKTVRAFDECFTAPAGGYGTSDNYYNRASSFHSLPNLRVPTLIIAAKDDPIVPFESFVYHRTDNEYVQLLATACGGHAGFVQRAKEDSIYDEYWAENRSVDFFKEVISTLERDNLFST